MAAATSEGNGMSATEAMQEQDSLSMRSMHSGRPVILSVDDDLTVLYTRFQLLSASGYGVISASDGAQALQLFAEHQIDLVLLDYALPEMDGGMVADAMKAHRPNIPIIMISGIEVPQQVLTLVNDYVRKGEGPETLLNSIQKALNGSGPRASQAAAS